MTNDDAKEPIVVTRVIGRDVELSSFPLPPHFLIRPAIEPE
jgi:hypothetical protein